MIMRHRRDFEAANESIMRAAPAASIVSIWGMNHFLAAGNEYQEPLHSYG